MDGWRASHRRELDNAPDPGEKAGSTAMKARNYPEVIGVRYTGWAALDRDPQSDRVEFVCPHCEAHSDKAARRARADYRFTDGFLQDLQGEAATCRVCKKPLRVVPVVMIHDQDEKRRFESVFMVDELAFSAN